MGVEGECENDSWWSFCRFGVAEKEGGEGIRCEHMNA